MSDLEIVVVTKVATDGKQNGNMAMVSDLYWDSGEEEENYLTKTVPLIEGLQSAGLDAQQASGFWLNLRQPVFYVGEVLVLNEYGREIGYPGRKPGKWYVETETVATLDEAYELAQKVMREESK